VDGARCPIGVITDAELMRRLSPADHASLTQVLMSKLPFVHQSPEAQARLRQARGQSAADLMIAPAETVLADTPTEAAARIMLAERRKILPVVDRDGRLVGLVDRADLLESVAQL
jgi:CBS domain-containing protein